MSDKENLISIAEAANRYDLTALLEQVCKYSHPDEVRRHLTACYFTITRQIAATGEGAGAEAAEVLATLSLLIEATDQTTPTDEPPLVVGTGAARLTLEQYAAEIEATKKELTKARNRAGELSDLYNDLWQRAASTLPDKQRAKHKEFKARITGKPKE